MTVNKLSTILLLLLLSSNASALLCYNYADPIIPFTDYTFEYLGSSVSLASVFSNEMFSNEAQFISQYAAMLTSTANKTITKAVCHIVFYKNSMFGSIIKTRGNGYSSLSACEAAAMIDSEPITLLGIEVPNTGTYVLYEKCCNDADKCGIPTDAELASWAADTMPSSLVTSPPPRASQSPPPPKSSPTPSPTGSPTPSPTGSPTPSSTPTPSPTGSPTPSPTASPAPSLALGAAASAPAPAPAAAPGVSPGAAAGIAVGCAIVGAAIGCAVVFVIVKKMAVATASAAAAEPLPPNKVLPSPA
jgi:hypothetical protein